MYGWFLSYLDRESSDHISCQTNKKNTFKYTRAIYDISKKLNKGIDEKRALYYFSELFNEHNGFFFVKNLNEIKIVLDNDHEVLVLHHNYESSNSLE